MTTGLDLHMPSLIAKVVPLLVLVTEMWSRPEFQ